MAQYKSTHTGTQIDSITTKVLATSQSWDNSAINATNLIGKSGSWDDTASDLTSKSGSWTDAAADLTSKSGSWELIITDVNSKSGSWESAASDLTSKSGSWESAASDLTSKSGSWEWNNQFANTEVSDTYDLLTTDYYVDVDTSANSCSVQLFDASDVPAGWTCNVGDVSFSASLYNVTVNASGSQKANNSSSIVISGDGDAITLKSNGVDEWFIR